MLRQCTRKTNVPVLKWYLSALYAVESTTKRSCILNQCRGSATLLDINPFHNNTSPTSQLILPRLEPLEPSKPLGNTPQSKLTDQKFKPLDLMSRCSAYKKLDGKQCSRYICVNAEDKDKPAYCYQHKPKRKTLITKPDLSLVGTDLTKSKHTSLQDCWDLWIHPQIEKGNKELIKKEMVKPLSNNDRPGYIYVYSLDEEPRKSENSHAYFKIGRTNDPHRRMYQIAHACKFTPKIIELFPSFPKNDTLMSTNLETLDEEMIEELPTCPVSHRVERLILLELNGLYKKGGFKCSKCGTTHREWFRINRMKEDDRLMTDEELYRVFIRPTILRWIQYGVIASAIANK